MLPQKPLAQGSIRIRAVWSATVQTPLGSAAETAAPDIPSAALPVVRHRTKARNELRFAMVICPSPIGCGSESA
jgi:hypothetical protein